MDGLAQDLRFAIRSLAKAPGFTIVAVVTLTLAIGANAAVFSVIDAMILRPFPLPGIERLVSLHEAFPRQGRHDLSVSPANFLDWRAQQQSFEHLVATEWWDANLSGLNEPRRVQGFFVSPSFFDAMGVAPSAGRAFAADEDHAGRPEVVVLTHAFWSREFGADPSIVGKTIRLDGISHTVIGIGPRGFDFPMGAELWAPLRFGEYASRRDLRYLMVIGRLPAGRTQAQAASEMETIADRLARQYPDTNEGSSIRLRPLAEAVMDEGAGPFLTLWQGAAVFILLIGCANLGNLFLTRGAGRRRELALRVAMGASRWRVVRQLMAESLVVASAGTLCALPVAWVSLGQLRDSLPAEIRRFVGGWNAIGLNGRVLAFTALVGVGAAVAFGLVPALRASRTTLTDALKEGGRTGGASGRSRGRSALVVAEVALALALLVAAGLAVRGAARLITGDRGYRPGEAITFEVTLADRQYAGPAARREFHQELVRRLQALPGVSAASATNVLPASNNNSSRTLIVDSRQADRPSDRPVANFRVVDPTYLQTIGIPLLEGRTIEERDDERTQSVAVVSRLMADQLWPGQSAIGRRFRVASDTGEEWITIVGIVGDVLHHWFDQGPRPTFYRSLAQSPEPSMRFILRSAVGDPTTLVPAARAQVTALDRDQPIHTVATMKRLETTSTIGLRYMATLMSLFAAIALVLAAVGVYGVMAYAVSSRTHEIGVRIALGADRTDVLRLTLGYSLRLTAIGLVLGLLMAHAIGRLMAAQLFGVVTLETGTFVVVTTGLLLVALAAGYVPARRATKVDPMIALRAE